jgi:hypothetical protein
VQALAAPPAPAAPLAVTALPAKDTPGGEAADASAASAEIVAHVQTRGDVAIKLGDWMGQPGSKNWIEGFAVSPKSMVGPGDVEYQAVLGRGWLSPWAEGGQYCGSRGMSLPILGLRLRLRGDAAERFDCVVEATFVDGTKVGPLDNGEPCQAESMSPLEAFRITLVARDGTSPQATPAAETPKKTQSGKPAAKPATAPVVAKTKPSAKPALKSKTAVKSKPAPAKPAKPKR